MLLVILTETNGRAGGRSQEGTCAQGGQGCTGQDHTEALRSQGCCSDGSPSPSVGTMGRWGMPRVGYGAALAPLKAWPREAWPETEVLEAVCAGGAAGSVLSPLDHGSVR